MKRVNEYRDHEEIDLPIENMSLAVKIFTVLVDSSPKLKITTDVPNI
jgi:hypothetical protein